jgi:hypothetical protein
MDRPTGTLFPNPHAPAKRVWGARGVLVALALGGVTATTTPALGQSEAPTTPAPPITTAIGTCPSATATDDAVLSLIPDDSRGVLAGIRIEVEDLGTSYRVTVLLDGERTERTERVYSDRRRDCDERARFAAVFAALTLMPPQLGERERQETPPVRAPKPRVVRRHAPPPPPPPAPLTRIEAGVMGERSAPIGGDADVALFGGEIRAVLGRGDWAAGVALGYLARSSFDIGGVEANLERVPAAVFGRLRGRAGAIEVDADLGAGATLVRIQSSGLLLNKIQIRPEADVRAGGQLAWDLGGGIAPFVAARLTWVPIPYPIAVAPRREVGSLPHVWLGAMLGVSLAL